MKRTIPLLALSSSFAIVLSAPFALASTNISTSSKAIYFNGQVMSKPSGFVQNGTTYMPIWYVAQALKQAGIQDTWINGVMNFTLPKTMKVSVKPTTSKSGNVKIAINGQVVETPDGIVATDPSSNQPTEYMPIWYVMQALSQMNVSSGWDGTNWRMKMTSAATTSTTSSSTSSSSSKGSTSGNSAPGETATQLGSGSNSSSGGTSAGKASSSSTTSSSSAASSTSTGSGSNTDSSTPAVSVDDLIASILGTSSYSQLPQLSSGSSGVYVSALQSILMQLGYPVSETGQYDALTVSAVNQFEVAQGLTQDGKVTSTVWQALQQAVMNIPVPAPQGSTSSSGSSSTTTTSTPTSQPSGSGFPNVDLRFPAPSNINNASIDAFLQSSGSPMTGLGSSFMASQSTYGVDANYLVSHAILESNWGKSQISQAKNNLFGYGAYDSAPGQDAGLFPSEEYAILFQGWEVRNNNLNPGASEYVAPTLVGMNVHYATDPQWASSIGGIMSQFAKSVNDSVSSYVQYKPGNQAPAPTSTQEPVFYTHAAATVQPVLNYSGLPYFSSPAVGASEMFFSVLQQGSVGSSVASVQSFLNQTMNSGLQVDGQFGPMTKQAVIAFEAAHGLPQTGQWSFSMWQMFNQAPPTIPVGQTVTVSKIAMGMENGLVVEWDYVDGYGWVDSQYLSLQNVYRAMVTQPLSTNTTIHVYASDKQAVLETIHSGDFVIASSSTPQGGFYSVELCDQTTGQVLPGYISTAEANLVQVH